MQDVNHAYLIQMKRSNGADEWRIMLHNAQTGEAQRVTTRQELCIFLLTLLDSAVPNDIAPQAASCPDVVKQEPDDRFSDLTHILPHLNFGILSSLY